MGQAGKGANSVDAQMRNRVLRSAGEIFNRKGYAATTVREIVATAGVSKPVLYYYFGSKEGVYLDLIREGFNRLEKLVEELHREKGTATGKLLWFCDQVFVLSEANMEQVRLMYAIYYGPPQGAPFFDFQAVHVKLQSIVKDLIVEGILAGEFRDESVEDMVLAVLGALNVVIEVRLGHPEVDLGRAGLSRILGVILKGIARPACGS
jgi:TetR/AcrR family transcriptional regulator